MNFKCPDCGSFKFGTSNCLAPHEERVGHCHGGCGFSWPRTDDYKYFEEETVKVPYEPSEEMLEAAAEAYFNAKRDGMKGVGDLAKDVYQAMIEEYLKNKN